MTREHKLALIVGFSLVLVVGVLISDHFSKASLGAPAEEVAINDPEGLGVPAGPRGLEVPLPDTTLAASTLPESPPLTESAPAPRPTIIDMAASAPAEPPTLDHGIDLVGARPPASGLRLPAGLEGMPAAVRLAEPLAEPAQPLRQSPAPPAGASGVRPVPAEPITIAPSPEPREQAKPAPAGRHEVVRGDTVMKIAKRYYGDASLWTSLRDANPGRIGPDGSVRLGVSLLIPARSAARAGPAAAGPVPGATPLAPPQPGSGDKPGATKPGASKPAPARGPATAPAPPPARTHTVVKGDTLSKIAHAHLGDRERWREIAALNGLGASGDIRVGMRLKLPAK
ncbi:MAG TPA: LysM peptidoglycan-binding domain-containing protein [Phycisphaerales bacterium]|nr:LysM peptidoglycan-binding domain-containing protein [Phycisphaerales bacterium]